LFDEELTKTYMKKLRVVVAEDNDMLRSRITAYLRRMAEITLVGEAKDGEEALRCVNELDPDLLTLDMFMPKMDGAEVISHLHRQQAWVKVIVFATYGDHHAATGSPYPGIVAYLQKENPEALAHAVRELAQNNGVVTGEVR